MLCCQLATNQLLLWCQFTTDRLFAVLLSCFSTHEATNISSRQTYVYIVQVFDTCVDSITVHDGGQLLALGSAAGVMSILRLPSALHTPLDKADKTAFTSVSCTAHAPGQGRQDCLHHRELHCTVHTPLDKADKTAFTTVSYTAHAPGEGRQECLHRRELHCTRPWKRQTRLPSPP